MKDLDAELPVPDIWRSTISAIVESLRRRDATLGADLPSLEPVSVDLTTRCLEAIDDYGRITLLSLPNEAWNTSIAVWCDGRWKCLIDLWVAEEGRSDLVLDLDVFEVDSGYRFRLHLVYVP